MSNWEHIFIYYMHVRLFINSEWIVCLYLTWSSGCIMIFCVWSNCLEEANILASSMDSANSLLWRVFCLLFNNIIKVTIDTHRTCKNNNNKNIKQFQDCVPMLCSCAICPPGLSIPRPVSPDWTIPLIFRI